MGGYAIADRGGWWLALWLGIMVLYFGFVEIKVMCSHCPHYAEQGSTLTCWANHGSPKLWRYRPGPMSLMEKVVFLAGLVVIWGLPLWFLVNSGSWPMLLLYIVCAAGFFVVLKLCFCSRCMNLACPLNGVAPADREEFFNKNPKVGRAWQDRAESLP